VKVVATKMGIGFLGIGFQPKAGLKDMPRMPKVCIVYLFSTV
jgi:glutamate--cysteine ligase